MEPDKEKEELLAALVREEAATETLRNTLRRITGILAEAGCIGVDAEASAMAARNLILSLRKK